MSETFAELQTLSDEDLVRKHDHLATTTAPGTNHYLQELARRDQHRQTQAILRYTLCVAIMTAVITIATVVNLVALVV